MSDLKFVGAPRRRRPRALLVGAAVGGPREPAPDTGGRPLGARAAGDARDATRAGIPPRSDGSVSARAAGRANEQRGLRNPAEPRSAAGAFARGAAVLGR